MKLFLMKLCSLVVALQGLLLLFFFIRFSPALEQMNRAYTALDQNENAWAIKMLIAATFIVVGLVAFLPKLTGGSVRRSVVIPTAHGNVAVQLEALRPALLKVLRKMPEIRKARLHLKPTKGREKVHIVAHITLKQQASLDVHQHVDIVAAHIADSTVRLLGLEDIAEVEVVVDGINVNAKAAAKAVQEEAQSFRAHLASHAKTEELALAAATAAAALDTVAVAAQHVDDPSPFSKLDEPASVAVAVPVEEEPYVEWQGEEEETGDAVETPGVESENLVPLSEGEDLSVLNDEATLNRDEADVSYALPPLSEQEEEETEESAEDVDDFASDGLAEQHKFNSGTGLGESDIEEERAEEEEGAVVTGSAPQADDLAWSPFNDAAASEEKTVDDEPGAFAAVFDEEPAQEEESRVTKGGAGDEGTDEGGADKKRWSFF